MMRARKGMTGDSQIWFIPITSVVWPAELLWPAVTRPNSKKTTVVSFGVQHSYSWAAGFRENFDVVMLLGAEIQTSEVYRFHVERMSDGREFDLSRVGRDK